MSKQATVQQKMSQQSGRNLPRNRNRKKDMVVGKCVSGPIKGVPKFVSLHVYRVDIGTNPSYLRDLLQIHFPEVTYEAITPHLYTSFKVNIYEESFKKAKNPEVWPKGTCESVFSAEEENQQIEV